MINLENFSRVVVKIGSSSTLHISNIVPSIVQNLLQKNIELIIVSSGAILKCKEKLNISDASETISLSQKQALSAHGQLALMSEYIEHFGKYGYDIAQILITLEDTENRRRYLNICDTIFDILQMGFIPIINQNDVVATSEIQFSDNDRLAARVASMMNANLLIILSDIDGFYDENPRNNKNAKHMDIVNISNIEKIIEESVNISTTNFGTGGIYTKALAVQHAYYSGISSILTASDIEDLLNFNINKKISYCEAFPEYKRNARDRWILNSLESHEYIVIDDGAYNAILGGSSILPVGVIQYSDKFDRGHLVNIKYKNKTIAKGLVEYSAKELRKNHNNKDMIPRKNYLIHTNNLVLL